MRRGIILALLALLVVPATAHGESQPDYLSTFSSAARHYFGGPSGALPPCGQPKFEWHSRVEMGTDRAADADPSTCVIRFVKEEWDHANTGDLGYMIMHEWGHLYIRAGGFGVIDSRVDASSHALDIPLMYKERTSWEDVPPLRAMLTWVQVCVRHRFDIECYPDVRLRHQTTVRSRRRVG